MSDFRVASPTSDAYSDEADSISIREKALLKRSVSKHHNNNFKAGYVAVNEEYLSKTGLRGRKTFAFWTLVALLIILAVGNLILTMIILSVLRLGKAMESIEFIPEADAIKFFGDTDLGHLYKRDGKLEGFRNSPMEISSQDSSVILSLSPKTGRPSTKFRMNQNGTVFGKFDSFDIKNKEGEYIYSLNEPNFKSVKGVNIFSSNLIKSNRIVSPIKGNLKIDGKMVHLKGAEGSNLDSKHISFTADQDVYLKVINGSIILSSRAGVFLDIKRIPITVLKQNSFISAQYKICVCMPQGKLFRIPVTNNLDSRIYCHHINMSPQNNPCI